MFGKKKQPELSDDEFAMQTLRNCRMSMCQVFQEQAVVDRISDDDAFMRGFFASPEYQEAFFAYARRMGRLEEK